MWVTYDEMLGYDLTAEVREAAVVLKAHLTPPTIALLREQLEAFHGRN